jgi:hypothetical protein
LNGPAVDAGIDERRQGHIAGNAAKAIKIGESHALTPYHK